MFQYFKNSLTALLIVCMMAPGFYMGMAPVQEVRAEDNLSTYFENAVGALAACAVTALVTYALVRTAVTVLESILAVPTNEVNIPIHTDSAFTSAATQAQVFKECLLDALAWAAKNIVYELVLKEIVNWINDGFDGGPAFLSDVNGFFKDVAFSVFDSFIESSGLDALLCAPFKQDVFDFMLKIRLQTKSYKCSIEDIVNNGGYDDMVKNGNLNFDGGGISGAMSLVNAGANPYSSLFDVQAEASAQITRETSNSKMVLSFGDGFQSPKCDINNDGVKEICTPGKFVGQQINEWMNGGLSMLMNADEVSEIVGAIVQTLVQKVLFDDDKGLLSGYDSSEEDIKQQWTDAGYDFSQADPDSGGTSSGGTDSEYELEMVYLTNPETGEIWTMDEDGVFVSSEGKEVTIDEDGEARDVTTGDIVDLGSFSIDTTSLGIDTQTTIDVTAALGATKDVLGAVLDKANTPALTGLGIVGSLLGIGTLTTLGIAAYATYSYAMDPTATSWDASFTARVEALQEVQREKQRMDKTNPTQTTDGFGPATGTGSDPSAPGGSAGTTGAGRQDLAGDAVGLGGDVAPDAGKAEPGTGSTNNEGYGNDGLSL